MKPRLAIAVILLAGIAVGSIAVQVMRQDGAGRGLAAVSEASAARLGDRVISTEELDARWRERAPSQYAQAMQAVYEGRMSALRGLVEDTLVAEAARSRGLAPEEFEKQEIVSRLQPVGPHDAELFYASNQDQMQGRAFAEMGEAIGEHLKRRAMERARESLVANLRLTSAPLQVMIDAPRLTLSVDADDPAIGSAGAAVTIVEFADFQCPFCARVEPTLKRLREQYGDAVRIVWKDFPLTSIHPGAFRASEASYCAAEQDGYWKYREQLFANQQALEPAQLTGYASASGLDAVRFSSCLGSSR